uniref:AMP-binding enzyme C-terminal domain-containing protein n=1 Tax=Ditylenchus dipsaci TaxID=166011 RepID=A0A915CQE4_9BILA
MAVSSRRLEENLLLAHEDVLESAVIGVPDDNRGEVPKAFVVLKIVDNVEAKVEEIFQFIHDQVAPFKHLHGGITPLTSLPKTTSGKVSKAQLKKLVDEQLHRDHHEEECSETIL